MHPVSILTFGIFFAGYITARWDLVTRLYELAIFAWDHGVIVRYQDHFTCAYIAKACLDTCRERVRWSHNPVPALPHSHPVHSRPRDRPG